MLAFGIALWSTENYSLLGLCTEYSQIIDRNLHLNRTPYLEITIIYIIIKIWMKTSHTVYLYCITSSDSKMHAGTKSQSKVIFSK